jgi:hypothetical protein
MNGEFKSYFKEKKHVKLKGRKRQKLTQAVFDRDGWCCVDCGDPYSLTLSHLEHAGMGGGKGPGDTEENTCCRCMTCHMKEENGQDGKVKR